MTIAACASRMFLRFFEETSASFKAFSAWAVENRSSTKIISMFLFMREVIEAARFLIFLYLLGL